MHIKKYTEKDRYGNTFSYEFDVPSLQEIPQPDPSIFKPKGTDTVPAMLTPGENVVNAEASRLPGVQPMLDELNDMGRAIQKKQGGPIPSYKQEGGFVIDDTMLDAIKQVESGGDPNALSGVGAGGQYQIMPATAQQPGYGVTPISLEDRFDPDKSRTFAKQYLQGIMRANPDFTKDEVITAYHSGVGNVRKAKMGQEELGPRGQEYANKVNTAMGEVPMPETKPVVYDSTPIESGFMSAQASTPDRIGDPGYIPEGEDPILPDVDPMNQGFIDKRDKEIFDFKNFRLNNKLSQERYKKDQLESLKNRLQKKQEEGFEINDNDLKQVEKLEDEIKRIDETIFKTQKEIDEENKEAIEKSERARVKLGIPKPKEIDINTEVKKKEAQKISDALANEEDIDQTVMTKEEVADYMVKNPGKTPADKFIDKAKEVGGVVLDKSMGYFKDAFSSMFDGEELARMAMIYAGSRAMGYGHGASLNYSMKNYVKRVEANQEYAKKAVLDKDFADRFTADSLAKYAKSADVNDLIPVGKSLSLQTVSGNVYIPGYGKATTFKGDDKIEYVQIEGIRYPVSSIKGVEKFDEKVHGDATVAKRYDTFGKDYADYINKQNNYNQGDKGYVAYKPIGTKANSIYRKILRQNGVNINDAPEMQMAVERAMGKFIQAQSDYKAGKIDIEPNDLESFVNIEVFTPLTGIKQAFISGTSPENLAKINKMIKDDMKNKNPKSPAYAEEYYNDWQGTLKAYKKVPKAEREVLIKEAAEKYEDGNKWSAFTLWVSRTSPDKIAELAKQ